MLDEDYTLKDTNHTAWWSWLVVLHGLVFLSGKREIFIYPLESDILAWLYCKNKVIRDPSFPQYLTVKAHYMD